MFRAHMQNLMNLFNILQHKKSKPSGCLNPIQFCWWGGKPTPALTFSGVTSGRCKYVHVRSRGLRTRHFGSP